MQIEYFFQTLFSSYISDPRWYPFIMIGIIIIALFLVYFLFSYIKSFIAWIFGVSEVSRLQKEQNELLRELIVLSEEQNNLLYELYIENEKKEEIIEVDDFTETAILKEVPHHTSQKINKNQNSEKNFKSPTKEDSENSSPYNHIKTNQSKKKKFFQKK